MANKSDKFYFENFISAAEIASKAANYLVDCLKDYRPENMNLMLINMHEFEHQGDDKRHEMSAALAKAFVTPIEREDLELISQNIDEVIDQIEEILQRFYMDRIACVPANALEFAEKLVESCELMKAMLSELDHFKKPHKLHEMIVALNHIEEECDALYLEAMYKASEYSDDALEILLIREIYDKMENCADACEHVGDCVETVVMKNT